MADVRQRTTLGNRFRFLVRFLGLTGVLAVAAGGTLLSTGPAVLPAAPDPVTFETAGSWLADSGQALVKATTAEVEPLTKVAAGLLLGGLAAVVVWLLVETLSALFLVTGRRTVVGTNSYLQTALAAALLVLLNVWSFTHYQRWDVTRDKQFTLPEPVREKLQRLDPSKPTDVVVLQLHKTAGGGEKPDALDFAAERKVVEKVRDLVDQLRELGPRFRVTVLDVEEEGYEARLDALTKGDESGLRAAIDAAPENSIFFRGGKGVQRMSFSEFLLLDKAASVQEIDTPTGRRKQATNLVLIPQGVQAFARKVEEVEEKKPKVGLLVIHPELSTRESSDDYSSGGLRRTLEANGFEVVDVLVKQWGGRGGPTPAASTFEENDFDRTERRYNYLSTQLAGLETLTRELAELQKTVDTTPVDKLAADRRFRAMIRGTLTTEEQKQELAAELRRIRENYAEGVRVLTDELKEVGPKYRDLSKNDRAVEGRRVTDIKAKLTAAVADCDLLIVPRLTTIDLAKGYVIRPSFFNLPQDHADVVQNFLASGKPVLALFGPTAFGSPQMDAEADPIEKLFGRIGIDFGSQTVLTDKEGRAAAERQGESLGSTVDLPSFAVVAQPGKGKPNPIAAALLTSGRASGLGLKLGKSGPRPVYVPDSVSARQGFPAAFLFTAKESWNEAKPLPEEEYLPKYEAAKPDDPKKGTRDEERRGPFPIGAAVEVPASAFDPKALAAQAAAAAGGLTGFAAAGLDATAFSKEKAGPAVRVVAYGHGGLFTGRKLDAHQEQLLLHTLNWQLKRQDRLPTDRPADETWKYPRAELTARQATLWHLGAFLGLPLLCGYLGLLVLMTRKVR